jgi:hypothetical protein
MKFSSKLVSVVLILASIAAASAFSLLGPLKSWQVERIGYDLGGDIGGPMNLGEGYRLNVPTVTYAYDQSFINYFGTNGVAAIETIIKILNDLPPMSSITNDGFNLYSKGQPVPMETKFVNFEAQALGLWDIKSVALSHLLEEMGLAEPERWVWALRSRVTTSAPSTNFSVIKLNYDPITRAPSSFVNGSLYSYQIVDGQTISDALEFLLDPLGTGFSSVAGHNAFTGEFFAGLTHDDVGGLKWLYSTNNIVNEVLLDTVTRGVPQGNGSVSGAWTPFFLSTNIFGGTNVIGNTNLFNTNTTVRTGLRPGVNKVRFKRVSFDSIIGQTFVPQTNLYTDTYFTNGRPMLQPVQRFIGIPDYVFTVEDLGVSPISGFPFQSARTTTAGWINNDLINGSSTLFGPGVITPPIQITFTDVYPAFFHQVPFLDELSAINAGVWGSFDGTTNPPVVYPAFGNWSLQALRGAVLGGGP